jgi:hypothetical protein
LVKQPSYGLSAENRGRDHLNEEQLRITEGWLHNIGYLSLVPQASSSKIVAIQQAKKPFPMILRSG